MAIFRQLAALGTSLTAARCHNQRADGRLKCGAIGMIATIATSATTIASIATN